jgi:nucleotide-binding universal stress UspA family protein
MFQKLIVPVDSWSTSSAAVRVAARMAAAVDGSVEVVTIVEQLMDTPLQRSALERGIELLGDLPVTPGYQVLVAESVAEGIARHVESTPGAMVLMSTHGHGRSAAVLGSTCDEVLRAIYGPVIVIGPNIDETAGRLDGTYVVPLDGSSRAGGVLPIVAGWTAEFGGTPWLVEVADPYTASNDYVFDSSYVSGQARDMRRRLHRPVEFEVLHDTHASKPIAAFAKESHASLIFLSTHGRTGLARLRAGSVAAGVIRHADCPVVLFRPPELNTSAPLLVSAGGAEQS